MSLPRGHVLFTTAILAAALAAVAAGILTWVIHGRRPAEPDLPQDYRHLVNPLPQDGVTRNNGMRIFLNKGCAACHGAHADGRGPAAKKLTPAPADFATGTVLQEHSDAWLFWRISEGKHGTAMPRWDGVLTEKERWEVISFLRSLQE